MKQLLRALNGAPVARGSLCWTIRGSWYECVRDASDRDRWRLGISGERHVIYGQDG